MRYKNEHYQNRNILDCLLAKLEADRQFKVFQVNDPCATTLMPKRIAKLSPLIFKSKLLAVYRWEMSKF